MRKIDRPVDLVAEDRAFLEEVYSRLKPLLHRLILSQGAAETDAEDILQEAFLHLWQKVDKLREMPDRRCFNYVYTTVRNSALSWLSCKSRQGTRPLAEELPDSAEKGPEEYCLSLEKEQVFRRAMDRLDEGSRRLLLLRYVLEESDEAIAASFGVKPSSVRMMLSRARAKLKTEMMKLEESGKGEEK